jgi:rod shape-determining protein MreD
VIVALRVTPLVLVAAVVQVTLVSGSHVLGAEPDLLLVTLVSIGLLRGSTVGAFSGFAAGLLVDVMTLGTLGVTSVLLTTAGYGAGRYGETTGQGRAYAAPLTAFAATIGVAVGGAALYYLLGETVAATEVARSIIPSALLSSVLVLAVLPVCRVVLGSSTHHPRARGVELV